MKDETTKIIIKKTPDEAVYYDWKDQVDLTEEANDIVIFGEREYVIFGDDKIADIIKGVYYDDEVEYDYETIEELNKICGGNWKDKIFSGYSQSDYAHCYYNSEKVSDGLLEELENFIMGKVDEFTVQESDSYIVFVPHDIVWKGKKAICEYLGFDPAESVVLVDNGYRKVYNYKELD